MTTILGSFLNIHNPSFNRSHVYQFPLPHNACLWLAHETSKKGRHFSSSLSLSFFSPLLLLLLLRFRIFPSNESFMTFLSSVNGWKYIFLLCFAFIVKCLLSFYVLKWISKRKNYKLMLTQKMALVEKKLTEDVFLFCLEEVLMMFEMLKMMNWWWFIKKAWKFNVFKHFNKF